MRKAILFVLLCRCVPAQQSGVEGIVSDSLTHQPMAGVHITLSAFSSPEAPPGDTYGAISGRDGHFSVSGMPPAVYFISARRNSYVYLAGKQLNVTLKPGEVSALNVEMSPQAAISGRVTDDNGDPVQHVEVAAVAAASGSPESKSRTAMLTRTDERGEFRIVGTPGRFYVQATPERGLMFDFPGRRAEDSANPMYGTTFYPGTASKDQATVLTVAAGREAAGIDIRLASRRGFKMSGVVTGAPAAAPAGAMVWLFSGSGGRRGLPSGGPFPTGPDGRFTISALAPGQYRVIARSADMLTSPALQSPPIEVSLESGHASNVTLALAQGEPLDGVLKIDGAPAEKLTVRMVGTSQGPFGELKGDVGAGGAFRFERVFPNRYRLSVLPLPENAYIKAVNVDGLETTDATLDLSRGVNGAKVKVTISRNGGQIEGRILGPDGEPLPTLAFVVLAATANEIGGERLKPVSPGTKFTFTGLRPGKYRLMTIGPEQMADDERDIGTAQAMFAKAPEIEVHEGDRIARDVKLTVQEDPSAQR